MARGNSIIVTCEPRGRREEGIVSTAEKPGTVMQRDPSVALAGGVHTYKVYQPGSNGEQPLGGFWVLLEDYGQGKTFDTAYVAGARGFLYCPLPGDELNLLVKN